MKTTLRADALLVLVALLQAQEGERTGSSLRTEQATPGYTLFAPLQSGSTFLIDLAGDVVHEWKTELNPGNAVYLLPSGNLLRCVRVEDNAPFRGGGIGGRLQELTPDGGVVWDYSLAHETYHHHHDVEPLPNGNVLAIVWEALTPARALELGRDPERVSSAGWWVDAVLEIEPVRPDGGKIVWRWSSADHLIQDLSEEYEGFGEVSQHPERIDVNADHREQPPESAAQRKQRAEMEAKMRALGYVGGDGEEGEDEEGAVSTLRSQGGGGGSDWLHTNSIDYDPEHDLIALSVRTLGEVWVIDHSTTSAQAASDRGGRFGRGGGLLYRWGNPRNYGRGGDGDRQLFGQHDATFVDGAGDTPNLLVFNNGSGRPGDTNWSSVVEIALPFDPETGFHREEKSAFGPAAPVWTYSAPNKTDFYSSFISGAQRLAGGNTLIVSGAQGRLFEVTPSGEIVWEYLNPHGGDLRSGGSGGPKRRGPPPGGPGGGEGPRRTPRGGDGPAGGPPRDGPPPERGPGDGPPEGRGAGGHRDMAPGAMFRALRLSPDDPGIRALLGAGR
jgi:hypothetical protein